MAKDIRQAAREMAARNRRKAEQGRAGRIFGGSYTVTFSAQEIEEIETRKRDLERKLREAELRQTLEPIATARH